LVCDFCLVDSLFSEQYHWISVQVCDNEYGVKSYTTVVYVNSYTRLVCTIGTVKFVFYSARKHTNCLIQNKTSALIKQFLYKQFKCRTCSGVLLLCSTFVIDLPFTASQYCFGKIFPVWNFPAFYFMHAYCPNGDGNQSSFGRFRYHYVNYRTFARR